MKINHLNRDAYIKDFFHRSYGKLCLFAARLLGDEVMAEDIVQDVFVKVCEKSDNLDFDSDKTIGYLYITVKNACLKHLRHEKVKQVYFEKEVFEWWEDPQIYREIVHAEAMSELYRAIKELPTGCMQIMQKSIFEELSNDEIAETLNLSVHTVRSQKRRAVSLLRARLDPNLRVLLFVLLADLLK